MYIIFNIVIVIENNINENNVEKCIKNNIYNNIK